MTYTHSFQAWSRQIWIPSQFSWALRENSSIHPKRKRKRGMGLTMMKKDKIVKMKPKKIRKRKFTFMTCSLRSKKHWKDLRCHHKWSRIASKLHQSTLISWAPASNYSSIKKQKLLMIVKLSTQHWKWLHSLSWWLSPKINFNPC